MSTVTLQKESIEVELDLLVEKGVKNHKAGKTRKIKTLSDLD
jgi:hypothetical protein